MDTGTIAQLIGSYGFPIVCCFFCFWYVKYALDKYAKQIEDVTTAHKEEMKEVTAAINNNTLVIQKLCNKLEGTNEKMEGTND